MGHRIEQVGARVEVHDVLDRVDAGADRELSPGQSLGVRCGAVPLPVRFVDERRDLLGCQLRGIRVLQLHRAGTRAHHLDEVSALAQLLTDGAADVVDAVGLSIPAQTAGRALT